MRQKIEAELPEAGFTIADRRDPSPQVSRTLERLRQFLTLIGLTALLVGGVGIANAVATFIDQRRKVIATMKSIGATSRMVLGIFLVQVLAVAAIGVGIGLVLGTLAPVVLDALFGDMLPIKAEMTVSPLSIVTALVYGFVVALLFTLWPLGRVERVSASMLFRDEVAPERTLPRPWVILTTLGIAAALVGFAMLMSDSKRIAFYFCVGLVVVFAVFYGLGTLVTWAARRMPRPRLPELALALGNLGAPGGLTRSVVLSLGAGLSLLVAVALADASLVRELEERLPTSSPDYFVLDVPKEDYAGMQRAGRAAGAGRGARGGADAARAAGAPQRRAGRGDQGAAGSAMGAQRRPRAHLCRRGAARLALVAGEWWPKDYDGEPLVSFEAELASKLGLKIGDKVTVNVLGRNVTATIANLREVKWESLAINFVMVFSPNTLAGAPHNLLVTIALPNDTTLATEGAAIRELGKAYPSITAIRVKDVLATFNARVRQGDDGGARRRQRDAARRRAGAGGRAGDGAAAAHPRSGRSSRCWARRAGAS